MYANAKRKNASPVGATEAENDLKKAGDGNLLSDTAIENKTKVDSNAIGQLIPKRLMTKRVVMFLASKLSVN